MPWDQSGFLDFRLQISFGGCRTGLVTDNGVLCTLLVFEESEITVSIKPKHYWTPSTISVGDDLLRAPCELTNNFKVARKSSSQVGSQHIRPACYITSQLSRGEWQLYWMQRNKFSVLNFILEIGQVRLLLNHICRNIHQYDDKRPSLDWSLSI